ncbi:MAG: amidohydrolase family protein [Edaphobacter sp.]
MVPKLLSNAVLSTLVATMWNMPLLAQRAKPAVPADAVYVHGDILTGEGLTSATPNRVSALAIQNGILIAVGNDSDILKLCGPKTEVVDLHGAFTMPGFNDAHVHLASAGHEKLTIDLVGVKSLAEMQQSIATAAKVAPAGTWLRGRGWDHTSWPSQQLPTRQDLDIITGDHPAVFTRVDGHIAIANSRALQMAGITGTTADPSGGKIDRDAYGTPTGIVRETAVDLVYNKVPASSHEQRRHALELAMQDAVAHGITSVQDYSTWDDFLVYEEMERENKLPLRISEWLTFLDPLPVLEAQRAHHPSDDPMLHTGMLKGFMDGSLGSRTAALNAPYSDDPGNSGIPQFDQAVLDRMTIERAAAGFQIGFHAIGDRAASMALKAFDEAETAVPTSTSLRFRIEHDQVIDPKDFGRYWWLGVIASMQPNHLLTDMNWAEARIGPERAENSYPWKRFVSQGTVLAFGTDYPVEPIAPFRGLYAAVTRESEDGSKTYYPEQAISIGQALYAYTQASAFAEHMETKKGKLVPGQFADLVVLDRDLLKAKPQEILKTQVLRTVVGGRTVFRANTGR